MIHTSKPWSSNRGPPPKFTLLANSIIEHLLECEYFISAYWFCANSRGPQVIVNISIKHAIFPEFPGPTIGHINCGPDPTELELFKFAENDKIRLDAADPTCFEKIDACLRAIIDSRGYSI